MENPFFSHETKKHSLTKFIILLFILISYFIYISFKYGIEGGFMITLLTWSFFVFCTPIADAGFLLDFPIRLLFNIRMIKSEMFVWIFATLLNLYMLTFNNSIYSSTFLLKLFHYILTHPFPMWIIIILSMAGTFLSIYFADEMIDVISYKDRKKYHKHMNKYYILTSAFLFIFIILFYNYLLKTMNINIPL